MHNVQNVNSSSTYPVQHTIDMGVLAKEKLTHLVLGVGILGCNWTPIRMVLKRTYC